MYFLYIVVSCSFISKFNDYVYIYTLFSWDYLILFYYYDLRYEKRGIILVWGARWVLFYFLSSLTESLWLLSAYPLSRCYDQICKNCQIWGLCLWPDFSVISDFGLILKKMLIDTDITANQYTKKSFWYWKSATKSGLKWTREVKLNRTKHKRWNTLYFNVWTLKWRHFEKNTRLYL